MVKAKDLNTTISTITLYLEQLDSNIEERDHLTKQLKLTPSTNDNYVLTNMLIKVKKYLTYLQDDLIDMLAKGDNISKLQASFEDLVTKYEYMTNKLSLDDQIDILEYLFEKKELPSKPIYKSVRFKDDVDEQDPEDDVLRLDLMGSRAYTPYSDNSTSDVNTFNQSNKQIFAEHSQRILQQDADLGILHGSVQRQHSMGLDINQEVDSHLIALNDLEQGVDGSFQRLNTATNRLNEFRRKVRENGSMVTIVVLTVILLLLLVVLN